MPPKLQRWKGEPHKGRNMLLSLWVKVYKITAFECLGYAEFHIWVFVCMSVIHGIKFGSDSVLLFLYFQLFFLSLALLDLAEKKKQDHMSTMFKTFRESSQCRWYRCVHKLTYWASGAVSYVIVAVVV